MSPRRAIIAALFLLPTGGTLVAQTPDLPFHAGQWGALYSLGSFSGLGFVHFSSPTRALVVDVGGSFVHSSSHDNDTLLNSPTISNSNLSTSIRIGSRGYRSIGTHVQRQITFGVTAGYSRLSSHGTSQDTQWDLMGGAFGELAGEWMVTPHLGVGASWGASVQFDHTNTSNVSQTNVNAILLSFGNIGVHGAFYF